MFFLRQRQREITVAQRTDSLRQAGFTVESAGERRFRITRRGVTAILEEAPAGRLRVERVGVSVGGEVADLIDGGYQKFIQAPGGRRAPALASQLQALHEFQEDLREILGLTSLYNESIGTVCDRHAYDRLSGR
jgi:hypothetical protein